MVSTTSKESKPTLRWIVTSPGTDTIIISVCCGPFLLLQDSSTEARKIDIIVFVQSQVVRRCPVNSSQAYDVNKSINLCRFQSQALSLLAVCVAHVFIRVFSSSLALVGKTRIIGVDASASAESHKKSTKVLVLPS